MQIADSVRDNPQPYYSIAFDEADGLMMIVLLYIIILYVLLYNFFKFRIEKKAMEKTASNMLEKANMLKRKAEMESLKLLPKYIKN